MRSLFFRILLFFGLAMIGAAVASFVVGAITQRRFSDKGPPFLTQALGIYAQTAADTFAREGAGATSQYLERVAKTASMDAQLFDANGNRVAGETELAGAPGLAARVLQTGSFERLQVGGLFLNAAPARSASGADYVLVAVDRAMPNFPRPGFLRFVLFDSTRLVPVLLIGGLLCFWLATYISSPLRQLRSVTQELAEGKLTARVSGTLLRRRDEIGYLSRDFNLMADRIESLVDAQRRLLGDISHELRSPLARLGVALGLARRRAGAEAGTALDRIEREGERLNELIGQLLALSRIETGTEQIDHSDIDLPAVIEQVVEDANFEAQERNRSATLGLCEPCRVTGTTELIRSAIENVVRNALRYTSEGTQAEVSLHCEMTNGNRHAVIRVRDHGVGVPEESISDIFRPFYRVGDDRDRMTGGSGLGLAIAGRSVRLHGGTIRASNANGGGLLVEISLPIK
jgi:signal transduction histidine kinase